MEKTSVKVKRAIARTKKTLKEVEEVIEIIGNVKSDVYIDNKVIKEMIRINK